MRVNDKSRLESGGDAAIVTRFAPSPTGRLHPGHALSAILAHDFARARGGTFLLRIEDIDGARSRPEHVAAILDDLRWLGLRWDGPVLYQSQRLGLYEDALDRLRGAGLLYPCFCTRADIAREIAASGSAPHGMGEVYPGICRDLAEAQRTRRIVAGEPHAWRIDMAAAARAGELVWRDCEGMDHRADPLAHGDVVLARKDAPASYHLAVTVDDAARHISHVIRGVDLLPFTDIHRLLQALLGLPTPVYCHHALLTDESGQRLAKRHGAPTLEALRRAGVDGHAFADDLRAGRMPVGIGAAKG